MWEQIRANKRKSVVLVMLMGVILMAVGGAIGLLWASPAYPAYYQSYNYDSTGAPPAPGINYAGLIMGVAIAGLVWFILTVVAFLGGDKILLASSHARPLEKSDHPQLFNIVEEMTIASGLPKMPTIYLLDDPAPNAFATGRSVDQSAIAVTTGLLARLNRDQLQGVIAHEMSHIINRDVMFMTLMGVCLGSIVLLSDIFLRSMFYGGIGSRRSRNSGRGEGGGQAILMIVAVVMAILGPILAQIIYFAASRRREYLADANAVVLTRYPEGLASALEVISKDPTPLASANRVTAPMYIHLPTQKSAFLGIGRTHPPISERVRILRSIGGAVSYKAYQQAWTAVDGRHAGALPASALASKKAFDVRPPSAEEKEAAPKKDQARYADDLMRKLNNFTLLACTCGMQIKLPPEFKQDHVTCPRCHKVLPVPAAQAAAALTAAQLAQRYTKTHGSDAA